ncbi:MAG: tripartite tricarboxylate transporter TctB family protein [Firmicutes bacterium]|nr:tripartite tricarboxylate transporter TctB family protein [Bacillota bacterium]
MTERKFSLNALSVIGFLGVLLGIWWASMASKLPGGSADGTPGAGSFPMAISIVLIILGAILIYNGLRENVAYFARKKEISDAMAKENLIAILLTVAGCALFVVLWYYTHYLIANFLLMFGLALLYKVKLPKALIFGIAFSVGSYYFFSKVLQVLLLAR